MNLFGYEISKKINSGESDKTVPELKSFANPMDSEGTSYVNSVGGGAGFNTQILDLDTHSTGSEKDLIKKYRQAAAQPECDIAINDILNQAIVADSGSAVNLVLDDVDLPDKIKKSIRIEFDSILKMLDFNFSGHDIFRRWYIDGKLYYHLLVDEGNLKAGIQEVRMIDPLNIKKVKEVKRKLDRQTGVETTSVSSEYYLYSESGGSGGNVKNNALKIDPNSVVYAPSGMLDEYGKFSISYLHKSIKLVNQLRIMEDSLVIYRISRAPERRIFYIDVGNLPKGKAEEYVQGIMSKYRNKLVYDATSGEISDDRKTMSMLEDFWLPRREGGKGTEISTLPGGENLSQIDDILFFQKKLYKSLNVPAGRLEDDNAFSVGRASEITRDEVKFQKFINRLRLKFSVLFIDMLKVQCLLKGIITKDDWPSIRENIDINYSEDNYFTELKNFEIMRERMAMLQDVEDYVGKYFSKKWVKTNVLNMTDEDMETQEKEMEADGSKNDAEGDDF